MSFIQKLWLDSLSKTISTLAAAAILAVLAAAWGYVTKVQWTSTVEMPLWRVVVWALFTLLCVVWIALAATFGVKNAIVRPVEAEVPVPESAANAQPESTSPFSEVALDSPLRLRFRYFKPRQPFSDAPTSGDKQWDGTFLAAFKLIGPKLRMEPVERDVLRAFNKALAVELDYEAVHVVDNDFQAMKIRLENFGVIYFDKQSKQLHWCLTDNGVKLLSKLHQ
ncbi:hypothetical protein [Caballeronia sp. AZ10_KS36]|uniref:hypothetical protein n=1 Tax=Caballeronia sp. AZ10_KS36 TaxID=2921757 RepID=UPI002028DF3C|nr:hypothetical protein [Caballeronia sp. AZ10_KS36]